MTPSGNQKPKSHGPTFESENFVTTKEGRERRGDNRGGAVDDAHGPTKE